MKRYFIQILMCVYMGITVYTPGALAPYAENPDLPKSSQEKKIEEYLLLKGLLYSVLAAADATENSTEKVYLERYGRFLEEKAKGLEFEAIRPFQESLPLFQKFLAFDFILKLISTTESQNPQDVEALKSSFSKSAGLPFKEIVSQHGNLLNVFGALPIYAEWKERLQTLLNVGKFAEEGNTESFQKTISEVREPEFRSLLEQVWDKVRGEVRKRDELEKATGAREVDFDRYARAIRMIDAGERLSVERNKIDFYKNYYDQVNAIIPGIERVFCLALYEDLKRSNWKERDLLPLSERLAERLKKEELTFSDVAWILNFYQSFKERAFWADETREREQGIKWGFKKVDFWTTMTGAPATTAPFLSRGMMGLLAEIAAISGITTGSALILGPKGALAAVAIAGFFTTAQYGDHYFKTGDLPSHNFLNQWGLNTLAILPMAVGFKALAALSPLLAVGIGTPLMGYQGYSHYHEAEYLQASLSALLAAAVAAQGIKLIGPRRARGQWRFVVPADEDPQITNIIRIGDYRSTEPPSEWIVHSHNGKPTDNIIRLEPRVVAPQVAARLKEAPVVDEGGPARKLEPQIVEEAPRIQIVEGSGSSSEIPGIEINPKVVSFSAKNLGFVFPVSHSFGAFRDQNEDGYRVEDPLFPKRDGKKLVIIIRKNAEQEMTGIFVKVVDADVSDQSLKFSPYDDVYSFGPPSSVTHAVSPQGSRNSGISASGGAQGGGEEEDSQKSPTDASFFSLVPISEIRFIEDRFRHAHRTDDAIRIISLGSGRLGLWERALEKRFKVEVTLFDREISEYMKHKIKGGAIEGDFFTYTPKIQYDMAIFNSPRFSSGSIESPDNFQRMAEVLEKFLKPGGIGIIFTEFTDQIFSQGSKTAVQDLERLFGVGNVVHLKTLEGYNLGLQFPFVSLNAGGEFFIVKKPLLDHPSAMVFHFEKERKRFGEWLKSNQETLFEKSESSLFRLEIETWLSLVLGEGWEKKKKYKKNPIDALIYIAVEADRERMNEQMHWDEEVYQKAISYLIQAAESSINWVTYEKKNEIWEQLAILKEKDIHQMVEYILKDFRGGLILHGTFFNRLESLAILLREEWEVGKATDPRYESLQIQLASLYALLIRGGIDTTIGLEILDDIPDLLRSGVTKVEEVCINFLDTYLLYFPAEPESKLKAELILYDLLARHKYNQSKQELVQKLKENIDTYWGIWEKQPQIGIDFFVKRMTDRKVPAFIKVKARQFLETLAADPALFGEVIVALMPYFELGDQEVDLVAKYQVQIFFLRDKVRPFLVYLRNERLGDIILIDKILRFIDEHSDAPPEDTPQGNFGGVKD